MVCWDHHNQAAIINQQTFKKPGIFISSNFQVRHAIYYTDKLEAQLHEIIIKFIFRVK